MTQNIDLFNEYAAIILSQLYESFPVKTEVSAFQVSGMTRQEFRRLRSIERADPQRMVVACSTIEWLLESDYIRGCRFVHRTFEHCVLTDKGLRVLRSTPESLQKPREPFGESLIRLVQEGSMDAAKGLVTRLLTLEIG